MGADSIFRRGRSHAICQDYALAGSYWGQSCALLSDGCSGIVDPEKPGSPYTDWGARLLVLAAWQCIGPLSEGHFSASGLIARALASATMMELPRTALDATLLIVAENESGDALVYQTGDGVIAWRERDGGAIRYETVRYAKGAPRYLSYLLDPAAHARLLGKDGVRGPGSGVRQEPGSDQEPRAKRAGSPTPSEAGGGLNQEPSDLLAGTFEVTSNRWTPKDGWGPQLCRLGRFDENTPWERRLRIPGPLSDLKGGSLYAQADVVAVLSDGAESFVDRDGETVSLETLLPELFSFKNLEGEFVTRRVRRFLERTCVQRGWRHEDDFSMSAVALRDVVMPEERADSRQQTADSPDEDSRGVDAFAAASEWAAHPGEP